MFDAIDDDVTRILVDDDITRIRATLTERDWLSARPDETNRAEARGAPAVPRWALGAAAALLLATAAGVSFVIAHGPGAPPAPHPIRPVIARAMAARSAPSAPVAVADLNAPMATLIADARRAGRPSGEIARLAAARAVLASRADEARTLAATSGRSDDAARASAALDAAGIDLARHEVAVLSEAASEGVGDAERQLASLRSPSLRRAEAALHVARAALTADAAAVSQPASSPEAAIAAADRALGDYSAFARVRADAVADAAISHRAALTSALARGRAAATEVASLARTPKPWFFAPAAKKRAYQALQDTAAAARSMSAELALQQSGGVRSLSRAAALSRRLEALESEALAESRQLQ